MSDTILKCTTRHVRIFTAIVENNDLFYDSGHLTLELDPDNEFVWSDKAIQKVQDFFRELVDAQAENELSDYTLRKIGSLLEDFIRQMLK